MINSSRFCLPFFSLIFFLKAFAVDFKSYEELKSPEILSKIQLTKPITKGSPSQLPSEIQVDNTINQNLNKDWNKHPLPKDMKTIVPYKKFQYIEGTGTRGGGSGLLVVNSQGFQEVKLLEIFRSENLAQYNLFFQVDPEILNIENMQNIDQATQSIFESILQRISRVAPNLGSKIRNLYQDELPFKNWTPVMQNLPLIDDETQYPLEQNKNKIQVASRRTHHIVYNIRAYAAMRAVSRAALWLHEYLYALSGLENSIKTQRAVSLFFSSDFLKIAEDQMKLTQLFFDLDLLAVSRKSIVSSLPQGASLADRKQVENCGKMTHINGQSQDRISVSIEFDSRNTVELQLTRPQAVVALNSIMWSKAFLEKAYPLFKYPGQKIMPDRICLDNHLKKITQVQSSLSHDEDMAVATEKVAQSEVDYFKALSRYAEMLERSSEPSRLAGGLFEVSQAKLALLENEIGFERELHTNLSKIIYPKILGEYLVQIEY